MTTPLESRAVLQRLTSTAVESSLSLFDRFSGSPEVVRAALLDSVPGEIAYFSDGSAALAADFYDEQREDANAPGRFRAQPVIADRTVKVRRAIAWASEPLFLVPATAAVVVRSRLAEVIQLEVARPYRDTILSNRSRDPESVGWRRIARANGCSFCKMLAGRGAVYRSKTAYFASHEHCHCVAQPVFSTNDTGEEIDVIQYIGSRRSRSPEQKALLRSYLESNYAA